VVFFHAGLGCPGGYVEGDVFFVISGYLITSLILKGLDRGTFSLRMFWERRIRRIFPALAVMVLFTAVAVWFLLLPDDLCILRSRQLQDEMV
jgi:peptidoglycan/LPS O-acetylase OafA/YrhL